MTGGCIGFDRRRAGLYAVLACVLSGAPAAAQTLPGPADAGRVAPPAPQERSSPRGATEAVASPQPPQMAPEGADQIDVTLASLQVDGVTAFPETQIRALYQERLGQSMPLSELWVIAQQITALYHSQGYFLSRAIVPPQETEDGQFTLQVIEGYIEQLRLEEPSLGEHRLVRRLLDGLKAERPVRLASIESALLRLNDLPGVSVGAVVEPLEDAPSGAVGLALISGDAPLQGRVALNNFSSRFLGPYQGSLVYQQDIIPLQRTTLSLLNTVQYEELGYVALTQEIPLSPELYVELGGAYVAAEPGYTLERNRIESNSASLDARLIYRPIRQRQENLTLYGGMGGRNTTGDIMDAPLTRDRIRTLQAGGRYDTRDGAGGYHLLGAELRRGIDGLGSSDAGELYLSRPEAEPDFTTLSLSYTYHRWLDDTWLALADIAGQWASAPLYSAEEFGFGGQRFGRAYDPSELTGDHGMAAAVELRYGGLEPWGDITVMPFAFVDIGRVWNEDAGNPAESAMSAGMGVTLAHMSGLTATLGAAFPVTRLIDHPIYGSGHAPRLLLEVSRSF